MTSLIDVIFLLLLFFMLSSTFSKFAEVELADASAQGERSVDRLLFLQVSPDTLRLDAAPVGIDELSSRLTEMPGGEATNLLVSLSGDVTSQRLTDILVILRQQSGLSFRVLAPT